MDTENNLDLMEDQVVITREEGTTAQRKNILISTWTLEHAMASLIKAYAEAGFSVEITASLFRTDEGEEQGIIIKGRNLE